MIVCNCCRKKVVPHQGDLNQDGSCIVQVRGRDTFEFAFYKRCGDYMLKLISAKMPEKKKGGA